jgi:hypothetical protein
MTAFAMQQPTGQAKGRAAPRRGRRAPLAAERPSGDQRTPQRSGPQRRCIASGEVQPQDCLLRFVIAPDGRVIADLAGKLPGRGLWLTPSRAALDKACSRNLFAKAARRPVTIPADLREGVTAALRKRCLELIGLARRSGLVAAGFEKCKARLAAGQAGLLLQASDAAADGRDRLAALGTAVRPGLAVVRLFTAAELGQVLGRDNAVHVVAMRAPLTGRLMVELGRLQQLLAPGDNPAQTDKAVPYDQAGNNQDGATEPLSQCRM